MKTKTRIAAFVVLVLMVVLAIRATRQISETNDAMAALAPRRNQLREAKDRMEGRLQMTRSALLELEQKSIAPAADSVRAKQGPNAGAVGNDPPKRPEAPARQPSPKTIVANDPRKMAEYVRNYRASLTWGYGGMFRALGFSPQQIEKFKDAEVWLEEARMDLEAAIDTQGLTSDSAEYKKLWADYDKTRAPKKREVLGDLAEKYFEYYWTQGVRVWVQELAWTGVFTGETVSSAQVERATDILAANSKRRGPDLPGVDRSTVDWAAASAQLKDVLSPSQIETIGLLIERDKAQEKVRQQNSRLTAQFKSQILAK